MDSDNAMRNDTLTTTTIQVTKTAHPAWKKYPENHPISDEPK
nr:hypothetical protein [Corynebacterium auriscanis]